MMEDKDMALFHASPWPTCTLFTMPPYNYPLYQVEVYEIAIILGKKCLNIGSNFS